LSNKIELPVIETLLLAKKDCPAAILPVGILGLAADLSASLGAAAVAVPPVRLYEA
jgi:hypothetical protein